MVMTFVLYMFLLLYGQMVMTSIIEEKNNRVLELVVSAVKPMQLMMGKIIGVALVAVVQIVLWGILLGVIAGWLWRLLRKVLKKDYLALPVTVTAPGNSFLSASTTSLR